MKKKKEMMCRKYSKLVYLLIMAMALTVMSISFVKAENSIESSVDLLHSDSIKQHDISEENWSVEGQGEEEAIETVELLIEGMVDDKDAQKVIEALWKCSGVEGVDVSHRDAKATIKAYVEEVNYTEIIDAIDNAGFAAEIAE